METHVSVASLRCFALVSAPCGGPLDPLPRYFFPFFAFLMAFLERFEPPGIPP